MFRVCISGGFDPLHVGHIRLIQAAGHYGQLFIILNSDGWLLRKKGYVFMPWAERSEILKELYSVYGVRSVDDTDGTVCEALRWLRPDIFCNGGDRVSANPAEAETCERLGIKQLFNVGGDKIQSSSWLVRSICLS